MNTTCHYCPAAARIGGNHWDGTRYITRDVCEECFDGGKLAVKPRAPRKPRAPKQIVANDWNMLVAFSARKR